MDLPYTSLLPLSRLQQTTKTCLYNDGEEEEHHFPGDIDASIKDLKTMTQAPDSNPIWAMPTLFHPPSNSLGIHPLNLFCGRTLGGTEVRYTLTDQPHVLLLMASGTSCGKPMSPRQAGWALLYGLTLDGIPLLASDRLEKKGPQGLEAQQSGSRAELRAVIAALKFRNWLEEGFIKIVIATSSAYVINGITRGQEYWITNDWNMPQGGQAPNRDLWEVVFNTCQDISKSGGAVEF